MIRREHFRLFAVLLILAGMLCLAGGCDFLKIERTRWLAPNKVIKAPREAMPVQAIRLSIGPADQVQELVPDATFPRPEDLEYSDEDYVIGPGDILDISVLDLFSEGIETVLKRQVSESGFIDLPRIEQLHAEGQTKTLLKDAIIEAYRMAALLRDPTVSITLLAQRQNTFSALGAVMRPSQYNIIRRDMRLLDAIALVGGITQSNISYIYVIRQAPPVRKHKIRPGEAKGDEKKPQKVESKPVGEIKKLPVKDGGLPPLPEIPGDVPSTGPAKSEEEIQKIEDLLKNPNSTIMPSYPVILLTDVTSIASVPPTTTPPPKSSKNQEYQWIRSDGGWKLVPRKAGIEAEPRKVPSKEVVPKELDKDNEVF